MSPACLLPLHCTLCGNQIRFVSIYTIFTFYTAKIPYTHNYNHTPNHRHMNPAFCRDGT